MPVVVPTWGVKASEFSNDDALIVMTSVMLRQLWWRLVRRDEDDRWKVISARSKRLFPYFSRIYAIQFAATEKESKQIQKALLGAWVAEAYSQATPIGPRDRRRLRRATMRGALPF